MRKHDSKWKTLIPLIVAIVVMTGVFILISYLSYRQNEIEDLENYARGLTKLIAGEIVDGDKIDAYIEQGRSHPDYAETEQKLYKLREAFPDVLYLYVYQVREDGFHVVFDLDTLDFKGSEPGTLEEFFPAFVKYIPDMLAGKELPIIESRERYGHLLSVCTPLFDSNGTCRAYIGADCSMEGLREYTRKVIGEVCCFALVAMVIVLAVGIFVTDRSVIRKMDKLEDRAYVDTLTGLQNRTAFYEYIGALNKKREAGYEDFSILMIDVNFLKRVNDTYGHEEGNIYLQGAAELMAKVFGRDCLYRIGGDEFVQILEGKAQDGVEDRIRTFNEEVKKLQADDSLKPWEKVSAAVGIAKYDKGRDATAEETFRRADEAMYREKVAVKAIRTDT